MEYRNRAKSRKLKRIILNTIESFKFKGINLSLEGKIILFGSIIGVFSLFSTWVEGVNGALNGNAFSDLVGSIGYILCFFIGLACFSIFSYSKKEKIKLSIDMHVKDYNIILNAGLCIILFSMSSLRYIQGLQKLGSDIIYGKGPILALVSGVLIIVGGYLMKRKANKNHDMMYLNEIHETENTDSSESNMKLPF